MRHHTSEFVISFCRFSVSFLFHRSCCIEIPDNKQTAATYSQNPSRNRVEAKHNRKCNENLNERATNKRIRHTSYLAECCTSSSSSGIWSSRSFRRVWETFDENVSNCAGNRKQMRANKTHLEASASTLWP